MIGTDSHTPMVNGIGVLGWGVGGLEAQTVMFGMPTVLRIPDVVGVRLTGELAARCPGDRPGAHRHAAPARDRRRRRVRRVLRPRRVDPLRRRPLCRRQHGAGVRCHDRLLPGRRRARSTTCARPGAMPRTSRGSRRTRRPHGLWFDPAAEPRYTRTIEIDLATHRHARGRAAAPAGPAAPTRAPRQALARIGFNPRQPHPELPKHADRDRRHHQLHQHVGPAPADRRRPARAQGAPARPDRAALGQDVAGARIARSRVATCERAGLTDDLAAVGFDIVGYGCTTCIGNSGPLPPMIREAMAPGSVHPVAVLSGNRNFPGRVHPDLDLGFLMSPPLVIAFALAGDAARDLRDEPVQTRAGRHARSACATCGPPRTRSMRACARALDPADFRRDFARASSQPEWHALRAPADARFPWDARSTILRRPPFASVDEGTQLGRYVAHPLLVARRRHHHRPHLAGERDPTRQPGRRLPGRARRRSRRPQRVCVTPRQLGSDAARGVPQQDRSSTCWRRVRRWHTRVHAPSGEVLPIWEAAQRYREAGDAVVLVAGERYGTGSSRDWAAKGQRLLGIRAVLASSFERIHRSNLIGMGILPLRLPPGARTRRDGPRTRRPHRDRGRTPTPSRHAAACRCASCAPTAASRPSQPSAAVETQFEVELLRAGGVIPHDPAPRACCSGLNRPSQSTDHSI